MVCKVRHRTRLVRNTGPVVGRQPLENLEDGPMAQVYGREDS